MASSVQSPVSGTYQGVDYSKSRLERATLPAGEFIECCFDGLNLQNADLSYRKFIRCSFVGTDLSYANCSFSDFTGSSFLDAKLYYTNFMRSKLAATRWEPKDCFGVTLTHECSTFRGMRLGQLWWYSWLYFMTQTLPVDVPVKEDLRDQVIALLGPRRYTALQRMFQCREV